MRVLRSILFVLVAIAITNVCKAQLLNKVTKANGTVASTGATIVNTAQTISATKSIIKGLLGSSKAKETNIIAITGIEYGSEDLELLKNAIKETKGVKDVVTNYKDETVTIMIKSKDNATELWDKIPQNNKLRFKLVQSEERSIILEYKIKDTDQTKNIEKETTDNVSFAVNKSNLVSSIDNNSSKAGKNLLNTNAGKIKASYFMQFDFNGQSVHLESEILEKDICSATYDPYGKMMTVTFFQKETNTGISFTIGDNLDKIKAKKYEFDSEKTNKEKETWENGTNTKQLNVVFQPGDDKRYQIQCSTDPTFQYQGSGYLNITKLNPVKGGAVEGEFQFSFPVSKTKDGPTEIQHVKSGKFRIAIQK